MGNGPCPALSCCCLWVQAVVQGPRTACWPRQRWSGSQIRDNTAPQIRSADQKAFVPWELHVWVEILLRLSCIWSWGGGVGPTAEDMMWHSRLTQRAWWKLPRRNEGNLACGSKWIAWMEYMALSNEVVNLFQPHRAIRLVNNISWVLITPFFLSYCGAWAELSSSSFP